MRHLLLSALFLLPTLAPAQEATWVSTDGPGYSDLATLVLDHEGQPLFGTASGTLVFSDGAWLPYTDVRDVLTVIDEDYLVSSDNYIFGGTGQNPFNEYEGRVRVWHRSSGADELLGQFTYTGGTAGGFAEQALVSPEGDVWVGFQHYYGLDGDLGDDAGVGVARLASEDVAAAPDAWTAAELPEEAASLYAFGWAPALGLLIATDDGVYALIGDAWSRLGLEGESVSAVVATDDDTLLAAGARTVYRSTDDGATWTTAATLPGTVGDLLVTDDAVLAAVASSGVYRSTDTGSSWTPTDLSASARDLAGTPGGPYYAAAEGATLYVSEDGLAWAAERFVAQYVRSLTLTAGGVIAQAGSLYRYSDEDWQRLPFDAPRLFISDFAASSTTGTYFAAAPYDRQDEEPGDFSSRLYRSDDEGATWQNVYSYAGITTGLAITDQGTVLLCNFQNEEGCSVERSTDGGETWTVALSSWPPSAFTQGPSGTLYARRTFMGLGFGLDVSTDDGQTWLDAGTAPTAIQTVLESPDGALLVGGCDGVFRSEDGGATWTVSDLALSTGALAQNSAGDLFAGLSPCFDDVPEPSGVYRSTDDGQTWHPYGLDERPVYSFALDAEGVLFAGTDRGVFRTDMTTVDTEAPATPQAFRVEPAYPNPFAGSATVAVTLAEAGSITVAVYDAVGRAVATLHDGPLAAGRHALTWTGARQASGVYFVRVTGPAGTRTVPVTLAR